MSKGNPEKHSTTSKLIALFVLTCGIIVFFFCRLYSLQIVHVDKYAIQSTKNHSYSTRIAAQRGEIFDRNNDTPLVINTDSFAVIVTPGEIPKEKYDTVTAKLAGYLGITKASIDKKIPVSKRNKFESITVKSNVNLNIISNIAENKYDLPGVSWASKPVRTYRHTPSLSHIIGYVGDIDDNEYTILKNSGLYTQKSIIGKNGIEQQYDALLQGKEGLETYVVNVSGQIISEEPVIIPPEMGNNLVLTIDSRIQKLVEESIGERVGASVVLKPATGEILAMVSYPYFDNNIFSLEDFGQEYARLDRNPSKPFLNRAVQVSYPPASTFKIIMSTAMLQENAFPSAKKIECRGKMVYGGRTFNCHYHPGHGWLDMKNAMAQSCDVYYWTVGRDNLGIEKIASYAHEFGFGQSTQIDLPNQVNGLVPTPEWKERNKNQKWLGGDTMACSIGQGYMEATPLQLADMIAMVSNEGKIYKPHLLKEVRDSKTNEVIKTVEPEILTESTIDNAVWKEIQEALRYTVTDGTPAYPMNNKLVQIACKTGTAEVNGFTDSWHSWLVAYAPYDAPPEDRICVATVIEAVNEWEWWAPYATNIIIQGIFANQTFDEAIDALHFRYLLDRKQNQSGRRE